MSQGETPRWHSTQVNGHPSIPGRHVESLPENYKVVQASSLGDLQDYVNAAVHRGYVCQGGIFVHNQLGKEYLQAMVKG